MADALIWGASGGIGQALVRTLKKEGWRVFAAARHTDQIPNEADYYLPFDVMVPAIIEEAVRSLAQNSRGLDLVVYAAGDLRPDLLKKTQLEDWSAVVQANLTGVFLAARYSLPVLNKGGTMMVLSAYIDHVLLPKMGAYAVAKAGLETLVEVLRKEHRRHNFSVVRPGTVNTPFWEKAPFSMPENAKSPESVAQAMLMHHHTGENSDLNL